MKIITKNFNKIFMKMAVLSMVAALSLFVLSGCGGDTKGDGELQTVKIGLLSIDDSFPFFIADKEGLFTKNGVTVELVPFSSARDKDTALEAGEIDGVMTDLVVTGLLNKGGLDVRAVTTALGATPKEGKFVILAAPNSGINTLADMKNQPIGIGNNTIIQFVADEILAMKGFAADEIKTQNIPDLKLRLDTLLAGNSIKGCILPDPLATLGSIEGAKVLIDDTDLGINLSQSVVVFSKDSIDNKSEEIKMTLAAFNEAKEMINKNGESYRDLLVEFAKVPQSMAKTYPMPTYTANSIPNEEEVGRVMNWMEKKGLLDKAYSYDQIVDKSFLE